jgi:hypothetical protein
MLPEMTANHSTKVTLEAHAELLERILCCRTNLSRRVDRGEQQRTAEQEAQTFWHD